MESRPSLHPLLLFRVPSQEAQETHSNPETFSNHSPHTPPGKVQRGRRSPHLQQSPSKRLPGPQVLVTLPAILPLSTHRPLFSRRHILPDLRTCPQPGPFGAQKPRAQSPGSFQARELGATQGSVISKGKALALKYAPAPWLLPSFFLGSDPRRQKGKSRSTLRRRGADPSLAALSPRSLGLAARSVAR